MKFPEPQDEHKWLQRLVGNWTFESECSMGPDQPPLKSSGTDSTRSLGGLWMLSDWHGAMPDGGSSDSLMSLGYDPAKKKYVGTFIASMMTHLWHYEGTREGDVLTLNTSGPSFAGDGTMSDYQDIIEIKSDDHRTLHSQFKGTDGNWVRFMTVNYHRAK